MSDYVTMSKINLYGRFGNQIFQYAFLRIYAKQFGLNYEVPPWIGQDLFGLQDPPISQELPVIKEVEQKKLSKLFSEQDPRFVNVDFRGYFQFHTSAYAPYKEFFRSLLQPSDQIESQLEEGMEKLRSKGKTVVGLHLRRGDYVNHNNFIFYPPPTDWYKKWLQDHWKFLDHPVLFLASDDVESVIGDFSEFKPITSKDLFENFPIAPYYPDHYVLSHCDILAISNSTFSFTASMLNEKGKLFLRPDIKYQMLLPYDPWSSSPLAYFYRSYY